MKPSLRRALFALVVIAMTTGTAQAQLVILALSAKSMFKSVQGVSKDEIKVGTLQDLSGPLADLGAQIRNGMVLRVEEINEQGGLNGRKLTLLIEDNGYDPGKAAQAAQKLVNQDKVFAVLGHLGTATNLAAMPIQFEKGVFNFFPVSAAREMYEPVHPLKFAFAASYFDQMRAGVRELKRHHPSTRPCALYQDDAFGLDVLRGAEAALKAEGKAFVEKIAYARQTADFATAVARMMTAHCDLVVLGTAQVETVATLTEARKAGFSPTFIASSAAYTERIHTQAGDAANGLYAMHTAAQPYLDTADDKLRFWANKYQTRFGEHPTVFSTYGYTVVDTFAAAVRAAGTGLNGEGFVKAMEAMKVPPDLFGSPALHFSARQRLGSHASRMSQIQMGRWVSVSGYLRVPHTD